MTSGHFNLFSEECEEVGSFVQAESNLYLYHKHTSTHLRRALTRRLNCGDADKTGGRKLAKSGFN
jgi:hypothetical protein